MPKIFLIKNRLHQQQLKLLESQNLIQSKSDDSFNIEYNSQSECGDNREPLSLVAKKQNNEKWNEYKNTSNATGKRITYQINPLLCFSSCVYFYYIKRKDSSVKFLIPHNLNNGLLLSTSLIYNHKVEH